MLVEALENACRPWLQELDPRVRICCAVSFAFLIAMVTTPPAASLALLVGIVAYAASSLPCRVLLKRLLPLNLMLGMLVLLLILPCVRFSDGNLTLTDAHPLERSLLLLLKSNAILLVITVFFSTIPPTVLGHSLECMRFPVKLTRLLLFTVRYLDVMHFEYRRLRDAMKVRGFVSKANYHTIHSLANLVGMLLVRAFDRAERIEAAMACRGFTGKFHVTHPLQLQSYDRRFGVLFAMLLIVLFSLEVMSWR